MQADLHAVEDLRDVLLLQASKRDKALIRERSTSYRESRGKLIPCILRQGSATIGVIFVTSASSEEDMTATLADEVQEIIVGSRFGGAWPECVRHPHQMLAHVQHDRAVWICPDTDEKICDIGEYSAAVASSA